MKHPSWASFILFGLPFGVFVTACSLAVERWGAVAFWSILIAALAVPVGLLRMERIKAYRDDVRGGLPILYGLLVSGIGWPLGLALWQGLLIAGGSGLVAWLLVDRIFPVPESPRDRRVID